MSRRAAIAAVSLAAVLAAREAAADPALPRIVTAPTAWIPEAGEVTATIGDDHRDYRFASIELGLGNLAAVQLDLDSDVRACTDCAARPNAIGLGRAAFRLGAHQDAWFRGMPALVFGVRQTFAARGHDWHGARAAEAYVVASREVRPGGWRVRAHGGVDAISAAIRGEAGELRMGARVRPTAGLELTAPQYPRTTLMGDLAWEPKLDAVAGPSPEWLAGWGVRYEAYAHLSIELAVRHREGEDLGGSTVMMRLNLHPGPRASVCQLSRR